MTNFTYFANLYINYELKNAISDSYSLSILSRNIRKKSKKNYTQQKMEEYVKLMEVDLKMMLTIGKTKILKQIIVYFQKLKSKKDKKKIWDFINKLYLSD